jgi:small subunit ribosomal protein S6
MDNTKKKNAYELLFVTDVSGLPEETEATVGKFVGLVESNGEIIDRTEWGRRRLEYPINDKKEGYYTIVTFRADPDFPAELERLLNIDEKVMRTLILKLDEEVAEKVARRAADRAEAAKRAAEEAAEAEAAEAEAETETEAEAVEEKAEESTEPEEAAAEKEEAKEEETASAE